MINKYSGNCGCGARVEAGAGMAYRDAAAGRWRVRCAACMAVSPASQEAAAAAGGGQGVALAPSPVEATYTLLSGHEASPYQAAVFDHFRYGRGSRIIKAVAGAGKTTTIKNAIRYLDPRLHVQMISFNVEATDQLKAAIAELEAKGERSYKNVRANSYNSLGMGAVRRALNLPNAQVRVDAGKCRRLLTERLGDTPEAERAARLYSAFACRLVGLAKGEGIGCLRPDVEAEWHALVDHHGLYLDSQEATVEEGIALARRLLGWSCEVAREGDLDFDDQLYLVVLWKLRLWRNDVVIVDECFVPETPILIGLNGEQRTIKEIYDSGYYGQIVTWSPEKGTHLSRVVGVKRVPIGKPLVRIRTRQRGYSKNGERLKPTTEILRYKERTLVCTVDHKIWTEGGWVSAGELKPGMVVKHETAALVVRSYQSRYAHTVAGRTALREKTDYKRFGGYKPKTFLNKGGNGKITREESLLKERLGEGWRINYVVRTGIKRQVVKHGLTTGKPGVGIGTEYKHSENLPLSYKIDLANPEDMIAIEIDGESHKSLQSKESDAKKDNWLKEKGWKVIRLSNEQVRSLTDDLLNEKIYGCPVEAEVISVEPWLNRKHDYVYDLTVKDTHCYFAHGLLVHNCQDTNPVQRALLHLALKDGGRLYAVGDERQAIYGFRGASADAMRLIAQEFRASELPLTVSYRCAHAVVERAQTWVPYIESHEAAPTGAVEDDVPLHAALGRLSPQDVVLCRQTAPLVSVAYGLIARGRACRILGREIGEGLINLIEQQRARGLDRLVKKLEDWREREMARFIAKGEEGRAEAVADRVDCILVIAQALPETERTVPALVARIQGMFADPRRGEVQTILTLATVHKAKGKEWGTVLILRPELMPSRAARQEWQEEQEVNLMYVAATRAKQRLIYALPEDMALDAPQAR